MSLKDLEEKNPQHPAQICAIYASVFSIDGSTKLAEHPIQIGGIKARTGLGLIMYQPAQQVKEISCVVWCENSLRRHTVRVCMSLVFESISSMLSQIVMKLEKFRQLQKMSTRLWTKCVKGKKLCCVQKTCNVAIIYSKNIHGREMKNIPNAWQGNECDMFMCLFCLQKETSANDIRKRK